MISRNFKSIDCDVLNQIRAQPFYKGQIYRTYIEEPCQAKKHSIGEFLDNYHNLFRQLVARMGIESLSDSQSKVVDRLASGKDVVFAGSPGCGKAEAISIGCVAASLCQQSSVLVLSPSKAAVDLRLRQIKKVLETGGCGYACHMVSAFDLGTDSLTIPDVLISTPEQLMRILERDASGQMISKEFFQSLDFVVVEDIHRYTGAFGRHFEYFMRCLWLERKRWRTDEWQFFATGLRYANVVEFSAKFAVKNLNNECLILDREDGNTRKQWVFWNAPLVWNESGSKFVRKDFLGDAKDLIRHIARSGLPCSSSSGRHLIFLIDVSPSMKGNRFDTLKQTLINDLPGLVDRKDRISVYPFSSELHEPIVDDTVDEIELGHTGRIAGFLDSELSKIKFDSHTAIGLSLKQLLEGLIRDNGVADAINVLLYSDGESDVPNGISRAVRKRLSKLERRDVSVRLVYVSLGLKPEKSVSRMVKRCGGVICDAAVQLEGDISPSHVLGASSDVERPVVVLSGGNIVEGDLTLAEITEYRREIVFHDLASRKALVSTGVDCITKSKYIIVLGWSASAALLRHTLKHIGENDATIFVVGKPDAASQAMQRQWPGHDSIPDVLSLGAESSRILQRVSKAFFHNQILSREEKDLLASSTEKEIVAERTICSPSRNTDLDQLGDYNHFGDSHSYLDLSGVVLKPIAIDGIPPSSETIYLDRLEPLKNLCSGGDLIWNGARFGVRSNGVDFEITGTLDQPVCVWPKANVTWTEIPAESSIPDTIASCSVRSARLRVECKLNEYASFPGLRFDEAPNITQLDEPVSFVFTTSALVLCPELKEEGVLLGLESLLNNYLPPLIADENRSLVIAANENAREIAIFVIADGLTDIPYLIQRNRYELLRSALRTGFLSMMQCPCTQAFALSAAVLSPAASDEGCPWCLLAPRKLSSFSSGVSKRRLIEFLGNAEIIDGYPWDTLIEHKYGVFGDNRRLTGNVPGGNICQNMINLIDDKLGIVIKDQDQATVAFARKNELKPNCMGLYSSSDNAIKLRPRNEFAVLDTLAHEYGHNWQAKEPLPPESPASVAGLHYNMENVEDPINIPFMGLLFVEGSAVWVETHAMDYYAYRAELDSRGVGAEEPGCFEYWQGLNVVKYIEEQYGLPKVFEFLLDGDISLTSGGEIEDLFDLYAVSGLSGFLVNQGQKASEDGLVPMFAHVDLNDCVNQIRVSAWLKARSDLINIVNTPSPYGLSKKEYLLKLKEGEITYDKLSIRTLMELPVLRDAGAESVLRNAGFEEYIEGGEKAWDISIWLAAHLSSSGRTSTSDLVAPLARFLKKVLK